jgi:hypothetical protein
MEVSEIILCNMALNHNKPTIIPASQRICLGCILCPGVSYNLKK